MEISVRSADLLREPSDLALLASFEDESLPEEVACLLEPGDYRGRAAQTLLLYPRGAVAPRRLCLIGLGKREGVSADTIRRVAATGVQKARALRIPAVTMGIHGDVPLPAALVAQALVEGLELGAYRYLRYRTNLDTDQTFEVERGVVCASTAAVEDVTAGARIGAAVGRGVTLARDLVNGPGYAVTPAMLAEKALSLRDRLGLKVTVLDKAQLIDQGFGGILAVGKGSQNDPHFIVMEHGEARPGAPTICLVGKGLTFDSGGLSLKPAQAMETMKSDLGGAAAVFGAIQVAAELDLPLRVVALVSAAENMPGPDAYRPGDIVRTLSGKTIEVLNTDAEGRIILSDALFYSQRYHPEAIVELSTLTGAIIIALGAHAIGMMSTDAALAERVRAAGDASAERVWELPLWPEYRAMIRSEVADVKNLAGPAAGSITAGAFLAEFVGEFPFVHLDVAGTAWADRPLKPYDGPGGTGVGVRLLAQFMTDYAR